MLRTRRLMKGRRLPLSFRLPSVLVLLLFATLAYGQVTVVGEDSIPLIGVEVYDDTYTHTGVTDTDGRVAFDQIDDDVVLYFKYLGYEEQNISWSALRENNYTITLLPVSEIIEEILVVGRTELSKEVLPYQIESISQEKLLSTNPQTSADALAQHGNLFVQKSQMGGGSPVVRGFEANKVLLVVDGVRLNNAIYRNGHLQNAITIDQNMLEQMDVIFGPNSLMYGSDALGGVIHFRSKNPALNFDPDLSMSTFGNAYVRYASANQENTGHIDFNIGGRKLASLTSVTYAKYGDLRTGDNRDDRFPDFGKRLEYIDVQGTEDVFVSNDDPNVQVGTGYRQFDILQKLLLHVNDDFQLTGNFQYSTSTDVPRYDKLIERDDNGLRFAEWYYGPQRRLMGSISAKHLSDNPLYSKAIFILGYQRIDEDRIDRRIGRSNLGYQLEDLNVWSFTADFQKMEEDNPNSFFYGLDVQYNDVQSTAYDEDIATQVRDTNVLTRYPSGGSMMVSYGAYSQYNRSFYQGKTNFNTGVRFTINHLSFSYAVSDPVIWPSRFITGVESDNHAFSWSAGLTQNFEKGWRLRTLVSTAFRSPNIDDMAKVRIKFPEVTFPNPDLKPERAISGEVSLEKSLMDGKSRIGAVTLTGFYTRLSDAIIRLPYTDSEGASTFIDEGDTLQIVANQNAQKARIYGVSLNGNYNFTPRWEVQGSVNWTKGRVIDEVDFPLSHIPPVYGQVGVKFKQDNFSVQLVERFNGAKPLDEYGDSSDNLEYATPIGSLAWQTTNLYGEYKFTDRLSMQIAAENIFDKHYRPFASGVSAPGFNLIGTIRASF